MINATVNQLNHRMSVRFSRIGVLNTIENFSLRSIGKVSRQLISIHTFCLPFALAMFSIIFFASRVFPTDISHKGLSHTKTWSTKGVNIWMPENNWKRILQSGTKYAAPATNKLKKIMSLLQLAEILNDMTYYRAIGQLKAKANPSILFHIPNDISMVHTIATVYTAIDDTPTDADLISLKWGHKGCLVKYLPTKNHVTINPTIFGMTVAINPVPKRTWEKSIMATLRPMKSERNPAMMAPTPNPQNTTILAITTWGQRYDSVRFQWMVTAYIAREP